MAHFNRVHFNRMAVLAVVGTLVLAADVEIAGPASAQRVKKVNSATKKSAPKVTKVPMTERIEIFARSYPDAIFAVKRNTIRTMSSTHIVIDDGRKKGFREKLADADIEDQLFQIYPVGRCFRSRKRYFNPGQIRRHDFFRLAYGSNSLKVKRASEIVDWFGSKLLFSKQHGAAEALKRVHRDLQALPEKYRKFLNPAGRTYDEATESNGLPSVHSYGIAIDINPEFANKWRRSGRKRRKIKFRNQIPLEIVDVFERHGFIWGGKWYRFMTRHFEYRPGAIAIGKVALERGCER